MSKFQHYYEKETLLEKVSKKEIDAALNNKNILIGAEFEWIMDEQGPNVDYDNAYRDWRQFDEDVDKAREELDEIRNEQWGLYQEIEKLEEELDNVQEEIDDEANRYQEEEEMYKKFEDKPDEYFKQYGTDKATKLGSIKWQMDDSTERQEKAEAKLAIIESDIEDKKSEYEARDDNMLDEIEWPVMGDDYNYYMENLGYEIIDNNDIFALVAEGSDNMPNEPPDIGGGDIQSSMESSGALSDAPFSDYEFGGYGQVSQKVGDTTWAIEDDSSLSDGGVEVKSPPMPLPEFMKILPDVFDWINQYGSTDHSTGMHVHLSVKGVDNLEGKINPLKMIMFMDEGWIWNAFDERVNNSYVKSTKDKLKSGNQLTDKDIQKIFDKKKLMFKLSTDHFDAINFQNIEKGHIEYRYMGGTNYSNKLKDIQSSIGHFSHNLSLGADDEYKKKEYAHKLSRVFNKMELWEYMKYLEYIKWGKKSMGQRKKGAPPKPKMPPKDMAMLNKLEKQFQSKRDVLQRVYKIDSRTERLLDLNGRYRQSIYDTWKKEMKPLFSPLAQQILGINK